LRVEHAVLLNELTWVIKPSDLQQKKSVFQGLESLIFPSDYVAFTCKKSNVSLTRFRADNVWILYRLDAAASTVVIAKIAVN
jgi:mRNA-degrading endonuclease RelE of RelBE toxin-antitoxin system